MSGLNRIEDGMLDTGLRTDKNGKVYPSLNDRLKESETKIKQSETDMSTVKSDITSVNAQLAENVQKDVKRNITDSSTLNIGLKENKRPLITFIDDDGKSEVLTRLKPIFDSKGIKGTLAIVSDWVNTAGHLTQKEIFGLQKEGWEIASHSKTHYGMGDETDLTVLYSELATSKRDLLQMGFDVKNIVYPGGQRNATVQNEVSKYYKVGVSTTSPSNNETNKSPLDNYNIRRVALGSYGGEAFDLAHFKSVVDKAVSENSWVVFMTHVKVQTTVYDQLLSDLIDYIKSLNVDIVTLDEGLNTFGDKMNINGLFRITPDNKFISDKFVIGVYDTFINSATKADDPAFILANYGEPNIIYSEFTSANASGMPNNVGGILITEIVSKDSGYISQTYKEYGTKKTWTRRQNTGGVFQAWELIATKLTSFVQNLDFGVINAKGTSSLNIAAPGVSYTNNVIVNPYYGINNGLIWTCAVSSVGNITIKVTNITDAAITPAAGNWTITVLGY